MQTIDLLSNEDFTLKKSERLCSKKSFEFLFEQGKSLFSYPIKLVYVQEKTEDVSYVKVAFGASKRNFKKAVNRNRIKRLLRESYRKHKLGKLDGVNQYLMFIYTSKKVESIVIIEKSIIKALNQIIEKNI